MTSLNYSAPGEATSWEVRAPESEGRSVQKSLFNTTVRTYFTHLTQLLNVYLTPAEYWGRKVGKEQGIGTFFIKKKRIVEVCSLQKKKKSLLTSVRPSVHSVSKMRCCRRYSKHGPVVPTSTASVSSCCNISNMRSTWPPMAVSSIRLRPSLKTNYIQNRKWPLYKKCMVNIT